MTVNRDLATGDQFALQALDELVAVGRERSGWVQFTGYIIAVTRDIRRATRDDAE